MKIVWDEPKRIANLEKHGFDFADIVDFAWETARISLSHSRRMKAVGRLGSGMVVVIYAELGREAISLISLRAASRSERSLADG